MSETFYIPTLTQTLAIIDLGSFTIHMLRNQYFGIFYPFPPSVIKRNHRYMWVAVVTSKTTMFLKKRIAQ